jgi:SAM-dependent methyltransferase
VLDVGAGTGAVCRALAAAGATPVAFDASADMLAHASTSALVAITGDMCSLPFLGGAFDAAFAAFSISHVETPEQALAEMRRVVRPAGLVVAAVFGASPPNASKEIVDEVARNFGFEAPGWYVTLKSSAEPRSNTPELLRECALVAGLVQVEIEDRTVDPGLESPEELVEYRIGMAHLAPFVASLRETRRASFLRRALTEVRRRGQPVLPRILILSSRAPA